MTDSPTNPELNGIVAVPNDGGGTATKLSLYRDGEELSRLWIVPYTLRVGVATVRMDGIGGVGTPEEHRNRGYSRQVLTAAIEYMKAGDAPLTTLYGIEHYYPKWGYATAAHEHIVRLNRLDMDNVLPDSLSMRAASVGDIPAIRSLYANGTHVVVGAVVRDDADRPWRELENATAAGADECRVIVDPTDTVLAYAWTAPSIWWMEMKVKQEPDGLHIGEAFASSPLAADALLAGLRQWATGSGKARVCLHQPPLGTLGMAQRLQYTEEQVTTFSEAQFMARSTGTLSLLKSLEPELSRRWRDARAEWHGTVRILCDGEAVDLVLAEDVTVESANGESTLTVTLTPGDLARLALGSFPPRDLLARIGVRGEVVEMLATLFPERQPYLYPADRF